MIAWLLVAWLAGAVALLAIEGRRSWRDLLTLAVWPALLPYALTVRTWRRLRYTCRDCGGRYGDRERLDLHRRLRTGCTVSPEGGEA